MEVVHVLFEQNGITHTLAAERIGENLFVLIENSIFNKEATLGTKIKASIGDEGKWIFKEVFEESPFHTRYFTIYTTPPFGPDVLEEFIGKPILEAGGEWEIVMGSIAIVSLPRDSSFDLDKLFQELNYHPSEWK